MLYKISITQENIKVDKKLNAKKGMAKIYDLINPCKVYPYIPNDHTPKFVIM